ncbi:MAG: MgtC/SapB family protein, partial [Clostridia bacterium]|nr:MgtC/SapB family protein [Clostridia bacterium]
MPTLNALFDTAIKLNIDWQFILTVVFRSFLAVMIGLLIGLERARHGRAAGMRTHVLVCLGSAITAMTG